MALSTSIVLVVIGAILAFAVEFEVAGIDIRVIGYILMVGGIVGAILSLLVFGPRRTTRSDTYVEPPRTEVVRERDRY